VAQGVIHLDASQGKPGNDDAGGNHPCRRDEDALTSRAVQGR